MQAYDLVRWAGKAAAVLAWCVTRQTAFTWVWPIAMTHSVKQTHFLCGQIRLDLHWLWHISSLAPCFVRYWGVNTETLAGPNSQSFRFPVHIFKWVWFFWWKKRKNDKQARLSKKTGDIKLVHEAWRCSHISNRKCKLHVLRKIQFQALMLAYVRFKFERPSRTLQQCSARHGLVCCSLITCFGRMEIKVRNE
jgi:hypothetical protein